MKTEGQQRSGQVGQHIPPVRGTADDVQALHHFHQSSPTQGRTQCQKQGNHVGFLSGRRSEEAQGKEKIESHVPDFIGSEEVIPRIIESHSRQDGEKGYESKPERGEGVTEFYYIHASIFLCMAGLAASIWRGVSARLPEKSETIPPASSTSTAPAATS